MDVVVLVVHGEIWTLHDSWAHQSPQPKCHLDRPKWHLGWFSCICWAH